MKELAKGWKCAWLQVGIMGVAFALTGDLTVGIGAGMFCAAGLMIYSTNQK